MKKLFELVALDVVTNLTSPEVSLHIYNCIYWTELVNRLCCAPVLHFLS